MGRMVRTFALEAPVSQGIDDQVPRGERSAFVNRALKQALDTEYGRNRVDS